MEDFKGTKGKWHVSGYNKTAVMSDRELEIADVYDGTDSAISGWTEVNRLEAEANAQLIAAAPELLALHQKFLEMFAEYDMRPEDELHEYASEVMDVIAKALGKEVDNE